MFHLIFTALKHAHKKGGGETTVHAHGPKHDTLQTLAVWVHGL